MKYFKFTMEKNDLKLAAASGSMLGLAFPPFPFPFLLFGALVPYLILIENRKSLSEISRITYFTFWIFGLITLYWVGSWTKEADPFLMISGTALVFFNPLLFLIPSTIYYFVRTNFSRTAAILFFPFFWVLYEYLYSVTEFRFPWLTLGNGLAEFKSYIQIADIIGAYGLSFLILCSNVLLYLLIKQFKREKKTNKIVASVFVLLILLPVIYGTVKLRKDYNSGKKIEVGLIQPDLNPWGKWNAGNLNEQLKLYFSLSVEAVKEGAELVVWPESALPVYLLSGSYTNAVNRIHNFIDSNNIALITGMPDVKFYDSLNAPWDAKKSSASSYYYATFNSALAFNAKSKEIQRYGKIKLVPFGEKVPYVEYLPFIGDLVKWNVGISGWNTGRDTTVFEIFQGGDTLKTAALICIESIYPDFVAQFVRKGAQFLTVVTNDSWYGNSSGPYQHKEISVLRAVENRRFIVRTANGGISCIIDPNGRVLVESSMFQRRVLTGEIFTNNGTTFFSEHPLIVPGLALIVSILLIVISLVKKISKAEE